MRVSETVHSGIQVIMRVIRGSVCAGRRRRDFRHQQLGCNHQHGQNAYRQLLRLRQVRDPQPVCAVEFGDPGLHRVKSR
jgi:hypothetical protein